MHRRYVRLWPRFRAILAALRAQCVSRLVDRIYELLPDVEELTYDADALAYPLLNMDSKAFVADLIREKVFLMMGEEIPYTSTVVVDEITERKNQSLYIKAQILTTENRYKKMIIGAAGRKIKEIGSYARKEIALATNKKVFLDLTVETDPHWQDVLYSS
jgi:GTP-binding protein Era